MYRRGNILSSTISIELPLRRSSSEIAGANRDPLRVTAIGSDRCARGNFFGIIGKCCARFLVSAFDQGPSRPRFPPIIARNYSAEFVAQTLARGIKLAIGAVALQFGFVT